MSTTPVIIRGSVGDLSAIIQRPDGKDMEKLPIAILMHGITADKTLPLIVDLADALEKHGIASLRFDFDGHGDSQGKFTDMTAPKEIVDAKKVYEYLEKLPNISKICLLGHSLGGVIASMLAGELAGKHQPYCVVLMAAAAVMKDDALNGCIFGHKFDH